jgi:hypothetical protein
MDGGPAIKLRRVLGEPAAAEDFLPQLHGEHPNA